MTAPAPGEGIIPSELVELCRIATRLPEPVRGQLMPLCRRLCRRLRESARLACIAEKAVDQLHVEIKYLLFDLEATRRERDDYRRRLERRAA